MEIVTQIMTFLAVTLPLAHPLTVSFFSPYCLSGKWVGTLTCSHLPSTQLASSDLLCVFCFKLMLTNQILCQFYFVVLAAGGMGGGLPHAA